MARRRAPKVRESELIARLIVDGDKEEGIEGIPNLRLWIYGDLSKDEWEQLLVWLDAFQEAGGTPPDELVAELPERLAYAIDPETRKWVIYGPVTIGEKQIDVYGVMWSEDTAHYGGHGDEWARGHGENVVEAFEDALEQLAQSDQGWNVDEADLWTDVPQIHQEHTVTSFLEELAVEQGINVDDPDEYDPWLEELTEWNQPTFLVIVSLWRP